MRVDQEFKEKYALHSSYLTRHDNKPRKYYFEIENLDEDYLEVRKILQESKITNFDIVASCIRANAPVLRVFSDEITGRFTIGKNISLFSLKNKLIEDGYIFTEKVKKSGPLCLNKDFSEPFSAKWFRLKMPWWEFKNGTLYYFFQKIKRFI
jgi:hypothetical protein